MWSGALPPSVPMSMSAGASASGSNRRRRSCGSMGSNSGRDADSAGRVWGSGTDSIAATREGPKVCRLPAGGEWIRTIGSPSRKEMNPFGNQNRHGGAKSSSRSGSLSSGYRIRCPPLVSHTNLPVATDIDSPHGNGVGSEIFAAQREICFRRRGIRQRLDHAGGVECLDPRTNDHDRREGRCHVPSQRKDDCRTPGAEKNRKVAAVVA